MFAALVAVPAACQPAAAPVALERSAAGLDQTVLTIVSGAKTHKFTVEVARSLEQQQTGMMNRNSLAPDRGMIFPYDPPQPVAFWMKNTLIPLDLIFVRADGRIASIAANATPMSLAMISASEPVTAVLEIAGGRAAALNIRPGDRVRWPR